MTPLATSMPMNDQRPCKFFKLPPELRNSIHELAFSYETNDDRSINLRDAIPPEKDLVMACQMVYQECRDMYKAASRKYISQQFVIDESDSHGTLARSCRLLQGSR